MHRYVHSKLQLERAWRLGHAQHFRSSPVVKPRRVDRETERARALSECFGGKCARSCSLEDPRGKTSGTLTGADDSPPQRLGSLGKFRERLVVALFPRCDNADSCREHCRVWMRKAGCAAAHRDIGLSNMDADKSNGMGRDCTHQFVTSQLRGCCTWTRSRPLKPRGQAYRRSENGGEEQVLVSLSLSWSVEGPLGTRRSRASIIASH